jgi:hypothetical protein
VAAVPSSFIDSHIAAIAEEEFWLLLGVGGAVLLVALVALFIAQSAFRRARTALTEARLARKEARETRLDNELATRHPPAELTPASGRQPFTQALEPDDESLEPRASEPRASEPRASEPREVSEPEMRAREIPPSPPDLTDLSTRRALHRQSHDSGATPRLAEPSIKARLTMDLRDPDPLVRIAALEGLAGDPSAQPDLIAALGDDFPHVRREAVRALQSLEGIEVVRAIIDVIDHDPAAEVREEALEVLVTSIRRHEAVHRGPSAD